jgi:hypothetical protein
MPNEVKRNLELERTMVTNVREGKFRDPAIHIGSENSIVLDDRRNGVDVISLIHVSAVPHKDMFNAPLSSFDLTKYEVVDFLGESLGCQSGITIYLPIRNGIGNRILPIRFKFSKTSFYDELRKKMESEKIIALFNSRMDKDRQSYLFGIFRSECLIFKSFALKEK